MWVTIPSQRAEAVECAVTASGGLEAPSTVAIPAGETGAMTRVRAAHAGASTLTVEDPSGGLAPGIAKVRVVSDSRCTTAEAPVLSVHLRLTDRVLLCDDSSQGKERISEILCWVQDGACAHGLPRISQEENQ